MDMYSKLFRSKRPTGCGVYRLNSGGFTLIEVVVAVVVLGIIGTLITINWAGFIRYQNLRKEAFSLLQELNSLKSRAISDNLPYFVTFDLTNNQYTVLRGTAENSNTLDGATELYRKNLGDNVSFGDAPAIGTLADELASKNWGSENGFLTIRPTNLNSFDTGYIYLTRNNRGFIIIKRGNINPLQIFSRDGNQWTEM
ncbi:hypothetical protein CHISP_2319 [Chitinispirillum alkaliphilum]|nr:hypothetical protein CHISP_2319 [Chitinispirillum alkaliphilum]